MLFISCNIVVIALTALLGSLAWVWGGIRGDLLPYFVPWTCLFVFETMMFFPQRTGGETKEEARARVWKQLRCDPLVWVSLALLLLLAIPFFNKALCPICDYDLIVRGKSSKAALPYLPWCVDLVNHLNTYFWFFAAFLAMLSAKHALRRPGKRLLLEFLVWNGVALAVFGFVQHYTGARAPFWSEISRSVPFFSAFGYPNMGGDYFTTLEFLAIGLWRRRLRELDAEDPKSSPHRIFWRRHYLLIAAALLYFAALNTLSRAAMILSTSGTVFLMFLAGVSAMKRMNKSKCVKSAAMMLVGIIAVVLLGMLFVSKEIRDEASTIGTVEALDRITGKSEAGVNTCLALIRDYPVFGCGGWGYMHFCPVKYYETSDPAKPVDFYPGTANVHNDYLQFICEHGSVGFALMVLVVVLAVVPTLKRWHGMAKEVQFVKHSGLPWPTGFFVFPPAGIAIFVAAIATLVHAFGDCPLRSPAILSLLLVELVCIEGFLPRPRYE